MADDIKELNTDCNSVVRKKKQRKRTPSLISAAAKASSMHRINEDSSPTATGPLHSPSFASSPSAADGASSEEESVAELDLGDVSEGECSYVDDYHMRRRRRQDEELDPGLRIPSTTVAAPRSTLPADVVKCPRFTEPADDSESLVDRPLRTPATPVSAPSPPASSRRNTSISVVPKPLPPAHDNGTSAAQPKSFVVPQHKREESRCGIDHSPTSLPKFRDPRTCMWTSSHAANSPSEDRSASLVNVLLQPLPPNFDSETQLPPFEKDYSSLIRLNLWAVIDGHGGGCVATYASEVLLPHVAATVSRALGCAIVSRGVCLVNGQLRDANALDLDGLIMTSDRSPANPNSIHYRSPYEASDSDDDGAATHVRGDDEATQESQEHESQRSHTEASVTSSLLPPASPQAPPTVSSLPVASESSAKTSVKTASSPVAREAPIGTHSPGEVAAITQAITESFLAVDEGWINSIDPVATHQTSCQSNGRWNSGACALTVFSIQRLEWTSVSEDHQERELHGPAKNLGHDTSQNKDAARRRMLDYAARAKSASSLSTISSTSSLTTTEDRVNTSGLESEITETEGEDDDHSKDDDKTRRRNPSRRDDRETLQKESLISAPGGCSCHCYRAYDALLYTAHVGDCRAVMLGSAPPRTIKVHGSAPGHPEATDDESSHHSSDETECLSSSDHDADSSDEEDINVQEKAASATNSSYTSYMRRPTRRQSRRRVKDDFGTNAPFIALPPLEGFRSVEIEIDSDREVPGNARSGWQHSGSSSSSSSTQDSHDNNPIINLPPVTRPIDLTTDHSAYNPAEVTAVLRRCNNAPRAISAGVGGGIKRVAGSLAVTRALGDAYLKTPLLSFSPYKRHAPYITARPEVNCRPIAKDGDKVLVLATDGVWERASGEDVLRWVRNFYAERTMRAERRQNRRQNQPDRCPADESASANVDEESDDRLSVHDKVGAKRDAARSPSPPIKRRKLRSNRWGLAPSGSQRNANVSDVIVRRVLNKVRRARNISSLHALMSLPPGRARRSKHDDITSCVVDLSAFVL
eukprot:scaffold912_cov119-Cylindrotheca_fusiformis.AAC.22